MHQPAKEELDGAAAAATAAAFAAWRRRRRHLLLTSGLILSSELCERLAYYSLSTNLVSRLASLGFGPGQASAAVTGWQGAAYAVCIVGAYASDALLGRYWVIFSGSVVYFAGLVAVVGVTAAASSAKGGGAAAALLGALAPCAFGTGFIKASVGSFGADQFMAPSPSSSSSSTEEGPGSASGSGSGPGPKEATPDPREARALARYWNFFYFAINVGALLASVAVVPIQESVSWTVGYAIPAAAFAASFALFLAGTRIYHRVRPRKGPFGRVSRVLWRALWSRRKAQVPEDKGELWQSDDDDDDGGGEEEKASSPPSSPSSLNAPLSSQSVSYTNYATWLDRAAVKDDEIDVADVDCGDDSAKNGASASCSSSSSPLKNKKPRGSASDAPCSLSAVEDTKRVLAYLSVCGSLVVFWLIYSNMTTAFVLQGNYGFDKTVGGGNFQIPSASLNAFNTIAIIILVPIYDSVVVPLVRRARASKAARVQRTVGGGVAWDGSPTHLERIGAGLLVSALSMLAGAAVEVARRRSAPSKKPSVFWVAPQYFLVGLAEVLCSIGALDLAFADAPDAMRSLLSAAALLSVALGNFAASGVSAAVERGGDGKEGRGGGWLPDPEREYPGKLVSYYLMLAAVSLVNFVFFVGVVARAYRYKAPKAKKTKTKKTTKGKRSSTA